MSGRPSVGVVGDALLDVYCSVSPGEWDAGIQAQSYRVVDEKACAGGAANLAAGVSSQGGEPALYSVIGADPAGDRLREVLSAWRVDHSCSTIAHNAGTRTLIRYDGDFSELPLRFDHKGTQEEAAIDWAGPDLNRLARHAAIVVADYGGIMTAAIAKRVVSAASRNRIPIMVDPGRGALDWYLGATMVKLNRKELEDFAGVTLRQPADLIAETQRLRSSLRAQVGIVTLAEDGVVATTDEDAILLPTRATTVRNPTGAGDSFAAGYIVAKCRGLDTRQCLEAALDAASLAVGTECTCPS